MEHNVKFERNTRTGRWRAQCSCNWMTIGSKEEVQALAATHDIEWVDADPAQPEPAVQP